MKNEELIERLKNPQKYRQTQPHVQQEKAPAPAEPQPQAQAQEVTFLSRLKGLEIIVGGMVVVVFLATLMVLMISKNQAENVVTTLDPGQLQGLTQDDAVFNPHQGVKYVEVREGQDRSVAARELGSTLPIISRFNFQALTPKNYEIIGAAPWALTTNFQSNLSDPEIIGYLLANDTMINAFLNRDDVGPLLEDPQLLASFCEDARTLEEFFTQETVQAVLADPQLVRTVMGSRFMSYLLISKSGKYFREHVPEALAIINQNPYLSSLRQNEGVVTAVKENPYLKKIATQLLAQPAAQAVSSDQKSGTKSNTKSGTKSGKKSGSKTKNTSRTKK